nr:hypothetical protein GCM10010200_022870 [Actinomadura rugatobispora]
MSCITGVSEGQGCAAEDIDDHFPALASSVCARPVKGDARRIRGGPGRPDGPARTAPRVSVTAARAASGDEQPVRRDGCSEPPLGACGERVGGYFSMLPASTGRVTPVM